MSERPSSIEFETLAEEYWRVDDWPALADSFQIGPAELPEWHQTFSGQGRSWEILRRLFSVAPIIGQIDQDDMRTWTRKDIAGKYSIPLAEVEHEIDHAVQHWEKSRAEREASVHLESFTDGDYANLTRFSSITSIPRDRAEGLLAAFNFTHLKDEVQRAQVVNRIISLQSYLASPHTRSSAREIIRLEMTMHAREGILISIQNRIDELVAKQADGSTHQKEIQGLEDRLAASDKEMRQLGDAHSKLMEKIGADDVDMNVKKQIHVGTVAYIIEQCRIFESDPENVFADGIFTAREIQWLVTPKGKRAPQYRPDVAIRMKEALAPENLWNPDYKPTPLARSVQQFLLRMVKAASGIEESDEVPSTHDDDDDDAAVATMGPGSLPLDHVTAPAGQSYTTPETETSASIGFF